MDDRTLPSAQREAVDDPDADLAGYRVGEVIGRGGMGEVLAAEDLRFHRTVAIKRMVAVRPDPDDVERFVREATIQAQLEHPAIVPVHDLGYDSRGWPFFSMKRVTGTTLADTLAQRTSTPQRLLRALVDASNAIDLAHSHGVVHRDVKPANIMLGEFGEVYVLDWGIARAAGEVAPAMSGSFESGDLTVTGALLGTPSYMSPEQRAAAPIGGPSDVYSLGAILFEILCGHKLRPESEADPATPPVTTSPAARAPELAIAPELDALCRDALAGDPAARPDAHAFAERLQRYLDGDRDLERRRKLAREQLAAAHAALAEVPDRRADAVAAAGRAIALDPTSPEAAQLLTSLLLKPREPVPAGAEADVTAEEKRIVAVNGVRAVLAYVVFLVALTLVSVLVPVKSYVQLALVFAAIGGNLVMSHVRVDAKGPLEMVMTGLLVVAFSRVTGPLILTPVLIAVILPALVQIPWVNEHRLALVAWALGTGLLPFAVEWLGLAGTTVWGGPEGIVSSSAVFDQTTATGWAATIVSDLLFVVFTTVFMRQLAADRRAAVREIHVQAWHLRQLVPVIGERSSRPAM